LRPKKITDAVFHHLRVVTKVKRIGKPGEEEFEGALGCCDIFGLVGFGFSPVAVIGHPDLPILTLLEVVVVDFGGFGVAQNEVMGGEVAFAVRLAAGGEDPVVVAQDGHYPAFVHCDPMLHAVAEGGEADAGVVGEDVGHRRVEPSVIFHLEGGGQVPMVKGNPGLDAIGQEFINQAVVEGDTFFVAFSFPIGLDAAPGDAETVSFQAHLRHQGNVLFIAMIMVTGPVPIFGFCRPAGGMTEYVPNVEALTAFEPGAFDLVTGRSGTPDEVFGEVFGHSFRNFGQDNSGLGCDLSFLIEAGNQKYQAV